MSLSSPNHRAVADLVTALIPQFDHAGVARWIEMSGYQPRYNVAPGQNHWIVRGRDGRPILAQARWGLLGAQAKRIINARAETVDGRPTFRPLLRSAPAPAPAPAQRGRAHGRCLVVADGFFEWDRSDGGRQPWWFRNADGGGLLFAGLVDTKPGSEDQFVILTVPANATVAPLHDRMPAILAPADAQRWLFEPAEQVVPLLRPAPGSALRATAVSRRINRVEHDDPECVVPVVVARQGALF